MFVSVVLIDFFCEFTFLAAAGLAVAALKNIFGFLQVISIVLAYCHFFLDCGTPTPSKRIYSLNGKVVKSPRVGLFQKNRRSPRIKASLSHTALESVRSGTAVKKIRSSASAKKLLLIQDQENKPDILSKQNALKLQKVSASTSKLPPPVPFKLDSTRCLIT